MGRLVKTSIVWGKLKRSPNVPKMNVLIGPIGLNGAIALLHVTLERVTETGMFKHSENFSETLRTLYVIGVMNLFKGVVSMVRPGRKVV